MITTLSEAIRFGSLLHKQGFGNFQTNHLDWFQDGVQLEIRTCALGAAGKAMNVRPSQLFLSFPLLARCVPVPGAVLAQTLSIFLRRRQHGGPDHAPTLGDLIPATQRPRNVDARTDCGLGRAIRIR